MSSALDRSETDRQRTQRLLDQRKSATERNRLGQFSTPTPLAVEMAQLALYYLPETSELRVLDPGVGSGVFFYALRKTAGARRLRAASGFEIDHEVANEAKRLWANLGLQVRLEDFCSAAPPPDDGLKATVIVCNPPYIRHHHLSATQKLELRQQVKRLGLRISGLAGLYCYFLLLAHRWLVDGGVGVWIVPAEFLDVNYGTVVKEYLTSQVTLHRLHRFDPEDVQFTDALVSSVVVAFTKTPPAAEQKVELTTGNRLSKPRVIHTVPLKELRPDCKWGPRFANGESRVADEGVLTVGDLFTVRRGLATGANDFFILERSKARLLGIPAEFLRPILPGPRYVKTEHIDRSPDGFPSGLPELVLLDCDLPLEAIREQYASLAAYLRQGERLGISKRYLPAHRVLWYKQEHRPPAPILCTYMGRQNGGRAMRFLRNRSDATAPNVYLLLYPKAALAEACEREPEIIDGLFSALTEIAAGLSHGGRIYGGGLNKIEPKELENIALPPWVQDRYGLAVACRQRR